MTNIYLFLMATIFEQPRMVYLTFTPVDHSPYYRTVTEARRIGAV